VLRPKIDDGYAVAPIFGYGQLQEHWPAEGLIHNCRLTRYNYGN
jgi:hypothetical protein